MNIDLQKPLPNATYTVDGMFHYTTDEWARTARAEMDYLHVVDKDDTARHRNTQSTVAGIGRSVYPRKNWDGGNLAGTRFAGIPEQINLVPMPDYVNQSRTDYPNRSYWELENDIAAHPEEYNNIVIIPEYPNPPNDATSIINAERVPKGFTVEWVDSNGMSQSKPFSYY